MKLQQKYFLSYLFFISLFSIFFISYLYIFFSSQAKKELRNSAEKTYSQTVDLLNYQLKQYLSAAFVVSNSDEFVHAQEIPKAELLESPGLQNVTVNGMYEAVNRSLMAMPDVSMCVYVDEGFSYMLNHNTLEDLSCLFAYDWYEDFLESGSLTTWRLTSKPQRYSSRSMPAVSLFRRINTSPSLGWILELYILQEDLLAIIEKADPTENGVVFLQFNDGALLSTTDEPLTTKFLAESEGSFQKGQMNWEQFSVDDHDYRVYSRSLSNTGWYLTLLLPSDLKNYGPDILLNYAVLTLIVILIVSVLTARFFTHSFSRRLLQLDQKMALLCTGDFDVRLPVQGRDEIAQLFASFNYMAAEMKRLMRQQYEDSVRIKNAELNALQAQINPHFLYNTLDLINWKAMDVDATEIVEISRSLARYYRLTLSSGHILVPLQNEVEHILHYLDIQNYRFPKEIQTVIDIPEDCMQLLVPKLTLQPLVENSVVHGFLPKDSSSGTENVIHLRAVRIQEMLIITLSDNGIGMPQTVLRDILTENATAHKRSYGVINIQQRIHMLYGEECGMRYEAAPGEGVRVSIRLKAHIDPDTQMETFDNTF